MELASSNETARKRNLRLADIIEVLLMDQRSVNNYFLRVPACLTAPTGLRPPGRTQPRVGIRKNPPQHEHHHPALSLRYYCILQKKTCEVLPCSTNIKIVDTSSLICLQQQQNAFLSSHSPVSPLPVSRLRATPAVVGVTMVHRQAQIGCM